MTELKPCPFCGGEARTTIVRSTIPGYFRISHDAYCMKCNTEQRGAETEAEAITAWNERATPSADLTGWVSWDEIVRQEADRLGYNVDDWDSINGFCLFLLHKIELKTLHRQAMAESTEVESE